MKHSTLGLVSTIMVVVWFAATPARSAEPTISGRFLTMRFHRKDATIKVTDRRNGRVYRGKSRTRWLLREIREKMGK